MLLQVGKNNRIFVTMKRITVADITVEQYYKLREIDVDDSYELLSVLLDLDEEQKHKLLEKSYLQLTKMVSKVNIDNLDFEADKPLFVKIGRWIYKTPSDLDMIQYGRYLEATKILSDLQKEYSDFYQLETASHKVIPDVVAVILGCKKADVMKANAKKIISLGAFFLQKLEESKALKQQLRESVMNQLTSRQG